ncbi:MAG: SHOCT domain-containing protein [Planctomycetota bacterium]
MLRGSGGSRPSKPMSLLSVVAMIGVLGVALVAFTGGPQAALPCFIVLFVLMAVGGVMYHLANAFSEDGVNTEEFDFRVSGDTPDHSLQDKQNAPDFADRLRDLEQLRADGLIDEAEYQAKRRQIMDDDW